MSEHKKKLSCPTGLKTTAGIEPFDYFEQLRGQGNLLWDESMRSWLVVDYETCRYIESNEDRFPNAYYKPNPLFDEIKGGLNITSMQGDDHRRMRHFHLKLLSPVAVQGYRQAFVKPILDFLMAPILERGCADLTAELGDQLPPRLTAALFGMPWQDDELVKQLLTLNDTVMTWIGMRAAGNKELESKARAASEQLNALILPYIHKRRSEPGADFISRTLADAHEYYEDISDQDIIAMCRELLLAASDTTTHAIANTLYLILTNPDMRAALDKNFEACIDPLIEEALRLYGSVQYQVRYAREDCVLNGVQIHKDESIILHHAAANRDPATYEGPLKADLERGQIRKHLAFGIGPRACPGAHLARVEIRDTVKAVFDSMANLQLDVSAAPPRFDGYYTRSWRPLNVRFDAV